MTINIPAQGVGKAEGTYCGRKHAAIITKLLITEKQYDR
jgi:hypothetical protein